MNNSFDIILLSGGLIAFALALISAFRLVQRLKAERHWSAGAFAIRLVPSSYFIYMFFRLALF